MNKPKNKPRKNAKKTSKPSKTRKTSKVGKKAKAKVKVPTVTTSSPTPVPDRKTSGNGRIKVLVSLPPDLIERLDTKVRSLGTNRSGEIQNAIESSLEGAV